MARASDDFYPREEASSSPHVGACAFNSVFLSALVQVRTGLLLPVHMLQIFQDIRT